MKKFQYHFEPKTGWMNDPNGLIFFKGKYHAFFQHNPHKPEWGQMHWGHAVSEDLLTWEELPIALYPDMPYENDGGCFSGSAIEKDGKMYLFYTSVSHEYGQTQSMAVSEDGLHFEKYGGNPIIKAAPAEGSADFRDPKVSMIDGHYYMVVGSGQNGQGKVLLYRSENLFDWTYLGVLYESDRYGAVFECPDFFKCGDTYVLMFSKMIEDMNKTQFITGDFDGVSFYPRTFSSPENGPQFYAPQTFPDKDGKRILIGWYYDWGKKLPHGAASAGALTIPRVLTVQNGNVHLFPVPQAQHLLTDRDELVEIHRDMVIMNGADRPAPLQHNGDIRCVHILRDEKALEVFINRGEASYAYWLKEN